MDTTTEMRKLIDAVKAQSFTSPMPQALHDMALLSGVIKDLSDRIAIRFDKNLNTKNKKKKKKSKASSKKLSVPKISKPTYTQSPKPSSATTQNTALPISNPATSTSISSQDYNSVAKNYASQQQSLAPVKPVPPQ